MVTISATNSQTKNMGRQIVQILVTKVISTIRERIIKFQSENPLETVKISKEIGFDTLETITFNTNEYRIVFLYLTDKPKVEIIIRLVDSTLDIKFMFFDYSIVFSCSFWYNIPDKKFTIPMNRCIGSFGMNANSNQLQMELMRLSYDKDFRLIFNKVLGFVFSSDRKEIWFLI